MNPARFLLGLGLLAGLLTATADAQVKVGDQVDYSFRTPPVGGYGVKSLEGLRGKPVLVEFWGTR